MNEIQIFENKEFGQVRTVVMNDEPYFVGKDVAGILKYKATTNMRKLIEEEDYIEIDPQSASFTGLFQNGTTLEPNKNVRRMLLINESGLYTAILNSTLPSAKKFKHWVTSEVLPSIRKYGAYMTKETIENILYSPDFIIQLATKLKNAEEACAIAEQKAIEEKSARQIAEKKIEEQQPLVDFAEKVSHSDNLINMGKMAKLLKDSDINIGRNKLFEWLRDKNILMSDNIPYQKYIDSGYFEVKESVFCTSTGYKTGQTTLVTGRGQVFIHKKLQEEYCA